jgi:HEAT repeat protein
MKTRSWMGGLLLLAAVIAVLIGLSLREPAYHGRSLRAWLRDLEHPSALVRHNAQEAVSYLGTNAVPTIQKMLHAEDLPIKTNIILLLSRQRFVRITFVPAREWRISAAQACFVLGPRAEPAIPDLFEFSLGDSYCRNLAESAMGQMGAGAVGRLSRELTNEDFHVRRTAAGALHHIGAPGIKAADALVNSLNDRYGSVRTEAALALGRMDPSPAILKGLAETLDDVEPEVRIAAAVSLIGFGERAIPVLSERLKTTDLKGSIRITNVLYQIAAARKNSSQE